MNAANLKLTDAVRGALADAVVLQNKTQTYHWNVTGPQFYALHKMFQDQYEELQEAIDDIAERLRAIGGTPPVGLRAMLDAAHVEDARDGIDAKAMLEDLLRGNESAAKSCSTALSLAQDAGDEATADLMIERIAAHDKAAWMLRSSVG